MKETICRLINHENQIQNSNFDHKNNKQLILTRVVLQLC